MSVEPDLLLDREGANRVQPQLSGEGFRLVDVTTCLGPVTQSPLDLAQHVQKEGERAFFVAGRRFAAQRLQHGTRVPEPVCPRQGVCLCPAQVLRKGQVLDPVSQMQPALQQLVGAAAEERLDPNERAEHQDERSLVAQLLRKAQGLPEMARGIRKVAPGHPVRSRQPLFHRDLEREVVASLL